MDPRPILEIVAAADRAIMAVYRRSRVEVEKKLDQSPVTKADLAAHEIIVSGLKKLTPEIPILSEESGITKEEMISIIVKEPLYWLIDPLDGTKEFLKKTSEFTVNIALIRKGIPAQGFVSAPALNLTYYTTPESQSVKIDELGKSHVLKCRPHNNEDFKCLVSRSHAGGEADSLRKRFPNVKVEGVGSSLKFLRIAEGSADLYVRAKPTSIWDTAAAHAIVVHAGGRVMDFHGTDLRYNHNNHLNPYFLVIGDQQISYRQFLP